MISILTYVLLFDFFFNDTATTEIYTLSLHDALPIWHGDPDQDAQTSLQRRVAQPDLEELGDEEQGADERDELREDDPVGGGDRKSTRLNSSHANISYAVFCLKKKKINKYQTQIIKIP